MWFGLLRARTSTRTPSDVCYIKKKNHKTLLDIDFIVRKNGVTGPDDFDRARNNTRIARTSPTPVKYYIVSVTRPRVVVLTGVASLVYKTKNRFY